MKPGMFRSWTGLYMALLGAGMVTVIIFLVIRAF